MGFPKTNNLFPYIVKYLTQFFYLITINYDCMLIIGQVRGYEVIAEHFDLVKEQTIIAMNWNIQPGDNLFAISNQETKRLFQFTWGIQKDGKKVYEIPIEGSSTEKPIKKRILQNKTFGITLRHNRLLIPCNYFIAAGESQAYLFFSQDRNPIALAGIYESDSCAVLTYPAYGLFKKLGVKRVPLIFPARSTRWCSNLRHLVDLSEMIYPFPDKFINGYPVNLKYVSEKLNDKRIAEPIGSYFRKKQVYKRMRKGDSQQKTKFYDGSSWGEWSKKN